jgi:hypothetical protein
VVFIWGLLLNHRMVVEKLSLFTGWSLSKGGL